MPADDGEIKMDAVEAGQATKHGAMGRHPHSHTGQLVMAGGQGEQPGVRMGLLTHSHIGCLETHQQLTCFFVR